MGWYKAHSSLNRERGSIDLIDRCINCGSEKRNWIDFAQKIKSLIKEWLQK